MSSSPRLILLHKQAVSARIRYLRFLDGVVFPDPLPDLSVVLDEGERGPDTDVVVHPSMVVGQAATKIGMDVSDIELESEFRAFVDTPDGTAPIYLARITTIDPPFELVDAIDARFIQITEARDLDPVQLELMRRAYTCVIE